MKTALMQKTRLSKQTALPVSKRQLTERTEEMNADLVWMFLRVGAAV